MTMTPDMLNEINKASAAKAASALSKFLNCPVGVDVEVTETVKLDNVNTVFPSKDRVVGLSIPLRGSLNGIALLIYSEKSALTLCDLLFHRKEGESKEFSSIEISALNEVANIVIGNFLTAFAMPLQIDELLHSVSKFSHKEYQEFITPITDKLTQCFKNGIVLEIIFHFNNVKIGGTGIFLFQERELEPYVEKTFPQRMQE